MKLYIYPLDISNVYLCYLSLYTLNLFPMRLCIFLLFCKSMLYFMGDKYYVN